MKLQELRDTIERSVPEDWLKVMHSGYRYNIHSLSEGSTRDVQLDVDSHHTLLTHLDDIDIQVAYGIDRDFPGTGQPQHHPRKFDWAEEFLHPDAGVVAVDYLYRGNVVDGTTVLSFDGAWLPFPEGASDESGYKLQFSGRSLRIARLLHALDYPMDLREQVHLMELAGLPIVED